MPPSTRRSSGASLKAGEESEEAAAASEAVEVTSKVRHAKLFIGGLTRNTTTKTLREHFGRYGRVLDCVAMRMPDGRPRGFGYVTLDSAVAADRCLAEPQEVDGRVVDMKRAVPGNQGSQAALLPTFRPDGSEKAADKAVHCSPLGDLSAFSPLTSQGTWAFAGLASGAASPPGLMHPASSNRQVQLDILDLLHCNRPGASPQQATAASPASQRGLGSAAKPRPPGGRPQPSLGPMIFDENLQTPMRNHVVTPQADIKRELFGRSWQHAAEETPQKVDLPLQGGARRTALGDITELLAGRKGGLVTPHDPIKAPLPASLKPCLPPRYAGAENAGPPPPLEVCQPHVEKHAERWPPRRLAGTSSSMPVYDEGLSRGLNRADDIERKVLRRNAFTPGEFYDDGDLAEASQTLCLDPPPAEDRAKLAAEALLTAISGRAVAPGGAGDALVLPSVGSSEHAAGTCKRCNFFAKGRCQNESACRFCHLPHNKRKPTRQEKRERKVAWLRDRCQGEKLLPSDPVEEESAQDDETQVGAPSLSGQRAGEAVAAFAPYSCSAPPGLSPMLAQDVPSEAAAVRSLGRGTVDASALSRQALLSLRESALKMGASLAEM